MYHVVILLSAFFTPGLLAFSLSSSTHLSVMAFYCNICHASTPVVGGRVTDYSDGIFRYYLCTLCMSQCKRFALKEVRSDPRYDGTLQGALIDDHRWRDINDSMVNWIERKCQSRQTYQVTPVYDEPFVGSFCYQPY